MLLGSSSQAVRPGLGVGPTALCHARRRFTSAPQGRWQAMAPAHQRQSTVRHTRPATQLRVAAAEEQQLDEDEEELDLSYVDQLNLEYGIPNMIVFTEGDNGLPRVWLKHIDSSLGIELYLHGATLTSWLRPDGSPALSTHPGLSLHPDRGNKGAGLRLAFPQYRESTNMTLDDGFAGRLPWEVVAAGLTCSPIPDGMDGNMEARVDEYLRRAEEEPGFDDEEEEYADDPLDGDMLEVVKVEPEQEEELEGEGPEATSAAAAEASADSSAPKKARGRPKKSASPAPTPTAAAQGADQASPLQQPQAADQPQQQQQQQQEAQEAGQGAEEGEQGPVTIDEGVQGSNPAGGLEEDEEDEAGVGQGDEDEELGEDEFRLEEGGEVYVKLDQMHEAAFDMLMRIDEGFDPAPFVTLRLRDTEETRSIWPHKFELYYKLTVMEQDDYPSTEVADTGLATGNDDSVAALARDDMAAMERMIQDHPDPVLPVAGRRDDVTGLEVPTQLRIQLLLINKDEQTEDFCVEPMEFQVAALMQFAVQDIVSKGQFVKVLGLGNQQAIDYAHDERTGAVMAESNDYVHFLGHKLDATYCRALRADVKITPGDGTHYELIPRGGFSDVSVYHPGLNPRHPRDPARTLAGLGVGRMAAPKTLQPGESWSAEMVVRWHNHMWMTPIFGDGGAPFIPDLDNKEYASTEEGAALLQSQDEEDVAPAAQK